MPSKSAAQTLFEKADKKANSSSGWFSSASTKFEEAGDLYQQAANSYKLEKLFKEAGDAFAREAECREQCKEPNEAANAWWNAAKAYKQGYPERMYPVVYRRYHLISSRSGHPGIVTDNRPPYTNWPLPTGGRQGEGDRSDIPSRIQRPPQSMRKLRASWRLVCPGGCHRVSSVYHPDLYKNLTWQFVELPTHATRTRLISMQILKSIHKLLLVTNRLRTTPSTPR